MNYLKKKVKCNFSIRHNIPFLLAYGPSIDTGMFSKHKSLCPWKMRQNPWIHHQTFETGFCYRTSGWIQASHFQVVLMWLIDQTSVWFMFNTFDDHTFFSRARKRTSITTVQVSIKVKIKVIYDDSDSALLNRNSVKIVQFFFIFPRAIGFHNIF